MDSGRHRRRVEAPGALFDGRQPEPAAGFAFRSGFAQEPLATSLEGTARSPRADCARSPVVGARLAGRVAAARHRHPLPDLLLAWRLARSVAARPADRSRALRACRARVALAGASAEMARPWRRARPARPRRGPRAWAGPRHRGYARAWPWRRGLARAVGA